MLSKKEHIEYWKSTSADDMERAKIMLEKKDYVFSLFCICLSIEKLCKALWVSENESNTPPRIHEIKYLLADTSFEPDSSQALFIDTIQKYQIEGRYPDYKRLIYSYTTKEYTIKLIEEAQNFMICLHDKLSTRA